MLHNVEIKTINRKLEKETLQNSRFKLKKQRHL